ncbi:hypothetical protein C8R47DRAFT_802860, partial [Mycena vitilis]
THGASITPLAEFNQQFDLLRERRRLTPVADLLPLLDSNPAVSSSSVSSSADIELPGAAPAPGQASDDEHGDLPGLQTIVNSDDEHEPDADYDEDLFVQSPTLTRFNADDVALDMDVREWYLDGEDEGSEYDTSGDDASDDDA